METKTTLIISNRKKQFKYVVQIMSNGGLENAIHTGQIERDGEKQRMTYLPSLRKWMWEQILAEIK